jgi:membrane protease subunit (stomatin/prohibitin family)
VSPGSARVWPPGQSWGRRWLADSWAAWRCTRCSARRSATPAAEDPGAVAKLKELLDKSLISQAEFDTAKAEILKKLVG